MKSHMNSFVIADPNKCIGCRTCMAACAVEHSGEDFFHTDVDNINFNPRLNVVKTVKVSAPVQCRQCDDSPCAVVCPVKAISNKNEYVYINKNLCIGCKTCMVACPYGVIELINQYNDGQKIFQQNLKTMGTGRNTMNLKGKIVADKCDLCINRENGPACVEVCPTKALKLVSYKNKK